jgi:hypothetical protein
MIYDTDVTLCNFSPFQLLSIVEELPARTALTSSQLARTLAAAQQKSVPVQLISVSLGKENSKFSIYKDVTVHLLNMKA